MDPRSEVLLRQPSLFQGQVLLAGPPSDQLLTKLPQSTGWCWLANDFQVLNQYPNRIYFDVTAPQEKFNSAVLFLPKSKELTQYLLQTLASCLHTNGLLYVVGEKKAGIERAAKQLSLFGQTSKLDSARHCQLWQAQLSTCYARPVIENSFQTYTVEQLKISSLPGVFSHGRLDVGTQLLIKHLNNLPIGHLLDFGCGAGIVGSLLKQRYPQSTIYLQDIDAFAIASTEQTLKNNQLTATTITADGINASPLNLSAIVTNPPFHQGVQTSYLTTEKLLSEAIHHLKPNGELRLVANSFLKYQPIIEQAFGNCQVLDEAHGFKIYRAIK